MNYDKTEALRILSDAASRLCDEPELDGAATALLKELGELCSSVGFTTRPTEASDGLGTNPGIIVGSKFAGVSRAITFVSNQFFVSGLNGRQRLRVKGIVYCPGTGKFEGEEEDTFLVSKPGDPLHRRRAALAVLAEAVVKAIE